jgi:hypothetical protein
MTDATSLFVYVHDKEHFWVPAKIIQLDDQKVQVSIAKWRDQQEIVGGCVEVPLHRQELLHVNLKDYPNASLPLQNVTAHGEQQDVPDMVDLMYLHEVSDTASVCFFLCFFVYISILVTQHFPSPSFLIYI